MDLVTVNTNIVLVNLDLLRPDVNVTYEYPSM
jgi:hypothetical protein